MDSEYTNYSESGPSQRDLETQTKILELIGKKTKDLETFLNLNQKLRIAIIDLTHSYLFNNEESTSNFLFRTSKFIHDNKRVSKIY